MGFEDGIQTNQGAPKHEESKGPKTEAETTESMLDRWHSLMITEMVEKLKSHNMICTAVPLSDGIYSHALIVDKKIKESEPKIRVVRTIFTTQDNFIGDIFNQCGYALRKSGQSSLIAPAEGNVDRDSQLELLVDRFFEAPSMHTFTQICDLKQQRAISAEEQKALERELEIVEIEILKGGNVLDAVEGLVGLHPFSVSEVGLSPSVSISFADADKKPFRPAVSGVEVEGKRIVGLTLVIDIKPERLDFSDVWQGAVRKKIMSEEISAILISGPDSSGKEDNFQTVIGDIPGSVMQLSERNRILEELNAKRIAALDIEKDKLQALENRRSRKR